MHAKQNIFGLATCTCICMKSVQGCCIYLCWLPIRVPCVDRPWVFVVKSWTVSSQTGVPTPHHWAVNTQPQWHQRERRHFRYRQTSGPDMNRRRGKWNRHILLRWEVLSLGGMDWGVGGGGGIINTQVHVHVHIFVCMKKRFEWWVREISRVVSLYTKDQYDTCSYHCITYMDCIISKTIVQFLCLKVTSTYLHYLLL